MVVTETALGVQSAVGGGGRGRADGVDEGADVRGWDWLILDGTGLRGQLGTGWAEETADRAADQIGNTWARVRRLELFTAFAPA